MHSEHPDIIYIVDDKVTVVIPCRVTSPDIRPKLTQVRQGSTGAANKVGKTTNLDV